MIGAMERSRKDRDIFACQMNFPNTIGINKKDTEDVEKFFAYSTDWFHRKSFRFARIESPYPTNRGDAAES